MSDLAPDQLTDKARELIERGDLENARILIEKSCMENAKNAEAWMMLGTISGEYFQLDDAIGHFEKALSINPGYIDAYLALAKIQQLKGLQECALVNASRATELDPDHAVAWSTLGKMFMKAGKYEEAVSATRKAISLDPYLPDGRASLSEACLCSGKIKQKSGDADAAMKHYRCAIESAPGNAEAYALRGMLHLQQNQIDEAESDINRSLAIQPDLLVAIFHHGLIAHRKKDQATAADDFRTVIEGDPNNIAALNNLALALQDSFQLEEMRQTYERILEMLPCVPGAALTSDELGALYYNLAKVLRHQGLPEASVASYRKSLILMPDFELARSSLLLTLHYLPNADPNAIYQEHLEWSRAQNPASQHGYRHKKTSCTQRLRIGYVSPDFRKHSVAYFIEPLLSHHDINKYEIFCYSDVNTPDGVTTRFQSLTEHWRTTRDLNTDEMLEKIYNDNIDILVDLAGHTEGNRLQVFARRAAPVQVTYLGYPDTTGLDTIDCRITDEWADPMGDGDSLYSESLFRLSRPFLCYSPPEETPVIDSTPAQETGYITFGSLNNLAKVNDDVVKVWSRILQQVPGSRLLIKSIFLEDNGTRELYFERFQKQGIERSRLELCGPTITTEDHLAFYNRIDIALDTFPYNGTTTTCESLWMAVPVVSLKGRIHSARVGFSILNNIGLLDWVANDYDTYVNKASRFARDTEALNEIRHSLRNRFSHSQICDGMDFAKAVENVYETAWEQIALK